MVEADDVGYSCPIATAVERVGDAWTLLILRDASRGATRFDQFRQSLGIAPNILAKRLGDLVDAGLFEKHRYSERPPREEYRLTEAARDFLPILMALGVWGKKHFDDGHMAALADENGKPIDAVVVDGATGLPLRPAAPRPESGIAASLEGVQRLVLGGFDSNLGNLRAFGSAPAAPDKGVE
jgi:DNA-binding HxlR family transcriptional regulator